MYYAHPGALQGFASCKIQIFFQHTVALNKHACSDRVHLSRLYYFKFNPNEQREGKTKVLDLQLWHSNRVVVVLGGWNSGPRRRRCDRHLHRSCTLLLFTTIANRVLKVFQV